MFDDQLACADLVVLSKADLLSDETLASVESRLNGELRDGIRVIRSRGADLSPAVLIGLGAAAENDQVARASHHDEAEEHDHDDFDSFVASPPSAADTEAVRAAVKRALAEPGVLRLKGYAAVTGKSAPLVVQAVGDRVDLAFARPGSRTGAGLVVIGLKGLDRPAIEAALAGR